MFYLVKLDMIQYSIVALQWPTFQLGQMSAIRFFHTLKGYCLLVAPFLPQTQPEVSVGWETDC